MKNLRIMLVIPMLGGVLIPLWGCAAKQATASEIQVVSVQRGNLTVDIVSGGNLALSKKEDIAFDVGETKEAPVTVAEVLVEEGETVKEGQVLARLDTVPLEKAVKTAERAVRTAEIDLETAKDGEFKIKTAEYDLETATFNFNKLNYPYTFSTFTLDVPAAIEFIGQAKRQMAEAEKGLTAGSGSEDYGPALFWYMQAQINMAKALERLLRGQSIDVYSSENVSKTISDYTTARAALITMEKARYNLTQTERSVQSTLDKATLALEKAQDDLEEAKDSLAKAVITAPFDGFITKVNVAGGAKIQRGTVAVQLADPAKFEAKIMVGEKDIFQVKEGGTATIQVDAAVTIILPAKIAHISPTGTVQSGVVNYEVKIEAEILPPAGQSGQGQPSASARTGQSRSSSASSETGQSIASQFAQLREGLSVTVNIIVAERKDVLLVPNGVITRSGRNVQVQVMKNEALEQRVVKTGLSNWQYTEVTEGLSEGEQVVIPVTTSTSTTSSSSSSQPRPFMIPGIGR